MELRTGYRGRHRLHFDAEVERTIGTGKRFVDVEVGRRFVTLRCAAFPSRKAKLRKPDFEALLEARNNRGVVPADASPKRSRNGNGGGHA